VTAAAQQQRYEVRFDWGSAGRRRISPGAGVIVFAEGADGRVVSAIERGERVAGSADARDAAARSTSLVLAASLRNRTAVAQAVLQHQIDRGERVRVAIVAETSADAGFAVDALLTAGAVVDALATVGIDYSSPEAAAAGAAFTGLGRAVGHLYTASTVGQARIDDGERDAVVAAGTVDAAEAVPVLGADGYWSNQVS